MENVGIGLGNRGIKAENTGLSTENLGIGIENVGIGLGNVGIRAENLGMAPENKGSAAGTADFKMDHQIKRYTPRLCGDFPMDGNELNLFAAWQMGLKIKKET